MVENMTVTEAILLTVTLAAFWAGIYFMVGKNPPSSKTNKE
jgi:hypothetical protein